MDWLRRNWPDLAIGIALVAVIAGIVATLLTGGSFFPLGPGQPAATPTAPPAVTAPEPAPEVSPDPSAVTPDPAAEQPDPVADAPPAVADTPDVVDEPAAPDPAPAPAQPGVAVLAPDGTPADEPDPAPAPPVATTPPVTPDPAPVPDPAPSVATPSPAPAAPSPAAPIPAAAPDPEAPFRVSVGAFADPENAARQAETFRAAGYPVFTGVQGNLTIVLVGPYTTEADAAAVAARVRAGGFGIDPVIYRFDPDAAAPDAPAPPPVAPAPPTPSVEPAPTPPADPPPAAPPATRYLQVGAFASPESAQPLRDRLASLGYATSEVREDGMLKLLVGPFDAAALGEVRQRLASQGIESFAR